MRNLKRQVAGKIALTSYERLWYHKVKWIKTMMVQEAGFQRWSYPFRETKSPGWEFCQVLVVVEFHTGVSLLNKESRKWRGSALSDNEESVYEENGLFYINRNQGGTAEILSPSLASVKNMPARGGSFALSSSRAFPRKKTTSSLLERKFSSLEI